MRVELVSDAWAESAQVNIARELRAILYGSSDEQAEFLKTSLEAVDAHRKLVLPFIDARTRRKDKLAELARAAYQFAEAVSALDGDTQELLTQAQWSEQGKQDFPAFSKTAEAGAWARVTAKAADRLLKHKSATGRPSGNAGTLVVDIANAYAHYFRERPSAAREGVFARSLRVLLDAASIPRIGETQLARILRETHMVAPRPKRGRKARLGNHTKPSSKI